MEPTNEKNTSNESINSNQVSNEPADEELMFIDPADGNNERTNKDLISNKPVDKNLILNNALRMMNS